MLIGYARTSTVEQKSGLQGQIDQLTVTGCTKIFSEQVSSVAQRAQLEAALDFAREGDALCCVRLDRLARSTADLLTIIAKLEAKGVALRICDFGGQPVDTQSPSGKLIITMFGAVAAFERELLLQRQKEGIARAKREGRYKGRAPTARRRLSEIRALHAEGLSLPEIATRLGMSRSSAYRLLAEDRA